MPDDLLRLPALQQMRCGAEDASPTGRDEVSLPPPGGRASVVASVGGDVPQPAANKEEERRLKKREYGRRWRAANRAKRRAQNREGMRQWREANPYLVELIRSACNNPGLPRCALIAPVGEAANCMICSAGPGKQRLAADHDHDTGAPRGRLCHICNSRRVGDLESATLPTILYLARFGSDALTRLMALIVEAQITIAKEDAAYGL